MTTRQFPEMPLHRRSLMQTGLAAVGAGLLLPANVSRALAAVEIDPAKRIAAAKAEGGVSLYSSASTDPSNAIAEAFRKKYSIPVNVYRAGSATVATRVESEEAAGRHGVDTIIIEEPALGALSKYLADYDSPERANIPAEYKAPKHTLIRMYATQITWNSQAVKDSAAPKDWPALLDPKWKGRLGTLNPHVTATTLAWQVLVDKLYGSQFLEKFGANKPKAYASTNAITQAVISGEIEIGVVNSFGVIQLAAKGAPITGVIPKDTVLFGGNVAVLAKAPHPNAARLFCDYACSAEGQTVINEAGATIPTNPNAKSPQAGTLAQLENGRHLTQPDYEKLLADEKELLAAWDKYVT